MDQNTIRQLFSDAHVVDLDFSMWDQLISLYILADHMPRDETGRISLYKVAFLRVHDFAVTFSHYGIQLAHPDHHMQWRIDTVAIQNHQGRLRIELSRESTSPQISIDCEDISFTSVDLSILDRLLPDWDEPYSGLARPSIEQLARQSRRA